MSNEPSQQPSPPPRPMIPQALDGGLGYDEILRVPERLILALVGPWNGFADGDTVQILVGADPNPFGTAPASEDDRFGIVEVYLPAVNFSRLADGLHEVVARVVRRLGGPVDSIPTDVRLKLTVPGGHDPVADTPYRNENLDVPLVEPAIIGPDTLTVKVTVPPWDNMEDGDRLFLRWGRAGNERKHDVIGNEVGQPIVFELDREMIDKGGFGSGINVNYHIFDVVENWSLWSPPAEVDVEDPDTLSPPWVYPTVNGEGLVIDVDMLADGDVTAEVFSDLLSGDIVTVHFEGTTAEGSATDYTTPPQTVGVDPRPLHFTLPHALFPPLVQGVCAVGYTLERPGDGTYVSSRRRLQVHGQLQGLEQPYVEEAIGDTLDPADVPGGAHAAVPANALIVPGSRVTLSMYGTTTGGVPVGHEDHRDIGSVTPFPLRFLIPAGKIASLSGSEATFDYTVDTFQAGGGRRLRRRIRPNELYPSPERTYRIGSHAADLPPPTVPAAVGNRLDPADIDELIGAQVDVDQLTPNDRVTLTWEGSLDPALYTETLTARDSRLSFFVPKTPHVSGNEGGTVSTKYTIAGKGRSEPRVLQVGDAEEVPNITTVRDTKGEEIVHGGTTFDTAVTLFGTALAGQSVELFDSGTSVGEALVDGSGQWSKTLSDLAERSHGFKAHGKYGSDPVSRVYTVFVATATVPVIASVRDSEDEEIADGGTTKDTTLTLSGMAAANQPVELLDGSDSQGTVTVDASGAWSKTLTGLATGSRRFKARATYGSEPESEVFTVFIESVIGDLPEPSVPEAPGGTLPGDAPAATLRVPENAPLQAGDTVTGFFAGSQLGQRPATPNEVMDFAIPAALISANRGNTVSCHYSVLRDGATRDSAARPIVVTDPANEWDREYDFDQDRIRDIGRHGTIYFPEGPGDVMNMQFDPDTFIDPDEKLGVEQYPFEEDGDFSGNCVYIGYPPDTTNRNIVFINFHENWDVVRFAVTSVDRDVTLSFKDANRNIISGTITIPGGDPEKVTEVRYDDGGLRRIRHIEMRSLDVIRLDSFKFRR